MCEEKVVVLKRILRSVPGIALQTDEETFPAVRESMVSILCVCSQKRISLSLSILIVKETNTFV
jgi:hypothetical protein